MKDPIVEEIRRYRQEHAQRFQLDLAAICADLRKIQQQCDHPVVTLPPKKLNRSNSTSLRRPVMEHPTV